MALVRPYEVNVALINFNPFNTFISYDCAPSRFDDRSQ